jgi:hypothetical protein
MSISIDVDIDADDIVYNCSRSDKKELLEALLDDMDDKDIMDVLRAYKSENDNTIHYFNRINGYDTPGYSYFNQALMRLSRAYYQLSNDDINDIENKSKKY